MRVNIRLGGNKKNRDFPFYFYFNLPNNNVGGSVNQSIIKKRPYLHLPKSFMIYIMLFLIHFVYNTTNVKNMLLEEYSCLISTCWYVLNLRYVA